MTHSLSGCRFGRSSTRVLPHELCFGLFLVITWLRLSFAVGALSFDAVLYFTCIVGLFFAIYFTRYDGPKLWVPRLALVYYPLAMNVLFFNMKTAVPKIIEGKKDAALQSIDTAVLGGNLSMMLQPNIHPMLTELLSLCYLLFFPYLLLSLIYYFCEEIALLRKFIGGLFTIYGLGFLGYTLVPAAGPWVAMAADFNVPLTGYAFTRWNDAIVQQGSNGVDVFPSLHCAVSTFLLLFDFQHKRWRFYSYLLPCVGLWISTIYLRYHYVVDVVCGFALAVFALWITDRCSSAITKTVQPEPDHEQCAPTP